ncbi:phosphoglycerate mutase [Polychaeton citri CBS 116435]|uniref:Phosphoglycerate mutase n=1 Tax=Polychaeton citri CBS 116435 TaxID=1314669 RepID=A0A9P4QH15_9PEZI|nr:phosphoglycerate mutase [Polychaeton citri CBS 116435]
MGSTAPAKTFRYETVTGIFAQGEPDTDFKTYEYAKHNFGLINRTYPSDDDDQDSPSKTQWQRFSAYLRHLNANAASGASYKLIYHGRHGEGYHNVGEAKYGTKAWDDYWSKLDGDGELYWADAHLTERGQGQAREASRFYRQQFGEKVLMPVPQAYVVSPMYRCLQTSNITFAGLDLPTERSFKPKIKELLREVMGEHTCDKRSSRTVIHKSFPEYDIEDGFAEDDKLWQADHRETHEEHDARTHAFLDDVFLHYTKEDVFSFTSHSGAIASHLRVCGHREYRLPTGGLLPILVKATRVG